MDEGNIAELMAKAEALAAQVTTVFKPSRPITTKDLFAGRWTELTDISDAVHQAGLHVVIYGERGVGKTSLANVVGPTIRVFDRSSQTDEEGRVRWVVSAVANSGDTFSTLWHRLFRDIQWSNPDGGNPLTTRETFYLSETLGIDDVRRVVSQIDGAVFIIDEFDQAPREISKDFTELIKALSDLGVDCTIILVGVAETIENLVTDHASIKRAISQVRLKRMKPDELAIILKTAEKALQITFEDDAAKLIVHLSQGLPHYTHLIGLHAVRSAASRLSLHKVERDDVFEALKKAVKQAEETVTEKHSKAIHSSQKNALYRQVLLACAIAAARSQDALGYFSPSDIVEPLGKILNKPVKIATFTNHLREFCEERGLTLERDGQPWGYRYRFRDPLLVPFVFMDGLDAGIASGVGLVQMLND